MSKPKPGLRDVNTLYFSILDEEGDEIGRVVRDDKTNTWATEALTIEDRDPLRVVKRYDTPHGALGMLLSEISRSSRGL